MNSLVLIDRSTLKFTGFLRQNSRVPSNIVTGDLFDVTSKGRGGRGH